MTSTQVVIVALWLGTGLIAAISMARRGHRHWAWMLVALLLGPFAWPVFDERATGESAHVHQMSTGPAAPGLHVMAAIDGSEDAARAAIAAARLLRSSVGRVTLVTVVDYDTEAAGGPELERCARTLLDPVASRLDGDSPAEAVLAGPPVEALLAFAADQAVDLIVVGPRGRGLTQRVLGSVTAGLLSRSSVPVLVVGDRGVG
jgi:nucleotide-binding universal stress UspA family protein